MNGEEQMAASIADALGAMFRVSVISPGGAQSSFGVTSDHLTPMAEIPFPESPRSLRLEVDARALQDAHRTLHSLLAIGRLEPEPGAGPPIQLDRALDELLAVAEAEIGRPLPEMSRADRQRLVRFLDERGAFMLRKAVEQVADALGVSRFTVYNYLDSVRGN